MTNTFVFDTYALVEIINGNRNYIKYLNDKIIINNFIFAELCYALEKMKYPDADVLTQAYSNFIYPIKPSIIKESMKFRYKNKSKNLSITDCVSFFMAKSLGIKFLTGDKEFENIGDVEFVRK
ncbi:PIN domain-containing protein [Candidatus Pacearchaeota archaeon]|nr:PIN domain-containing protein [Candidatus Pacearchaeota archaeon]